MRHPPAYEVRNLRKVYAAPTVVANDGITFAVEPGESFGLLGPNGAGKTTLVRQLVGLLVPTLGEVRLFGEPIKTGARAERRVGRTVAYLPQGPVAMGELKVGEAIRWTGMLRGLGERSATAETDELVDGLELGGVVDRQLRKLSGGQRRLVHLAMTFVGRLPVLIFDEPTTDIDPGLRRRVWDLIENRVAAGAAAVLVTHDVAEAEHVLDRVAILHRGRVAAAGTPAELKANLAHRTRLEIVISEGAGIDVAHLADEIAEGAKVRGRRISAWVRADDAIRILDKTMSAVEPGALEDVHLVTPTLEDVYLSVADDPLEAG